MAKQIQLRRGTTAEHNTFTGAVGEVTVDTDKKTLVVHDGLTVGGTPLATSADLSTNIINYLPLAYPKSTPPIGYLALMGQAISQVTYPILYSLYGATLPDLRGQFLRGLDYGKGIDAGRTVLSEQGDAIRNITGQFKATLGGYSDNSDPQTGGAFSATEKASSKLGGSGDDDWARIYRFDASSVVPTASENRVKNIAFLYIVKAG